MAFQRETAGGRITLILVAAFRVPQSALWRLMEYELNTLCAQLWHRYYQIVNWLDVRFICLVHVEIGTSGAEEGGEDEAELTICKTIQIGKSKTCFLPINVIDKQAKAKGQTYFIPKQRRAPLEKGMKLYFISGVTFSSHRSGINSNGCGKMRGSRCWKYADMPTGTPAGITHSLNRRGCFGETRGRRCMVP